MPYSQISTNFKLNNPKQIGESGHVEYSWSNNMREKVLQLNFQLIRTASINDNTFYLLRNEYIKLLQNLKLTMNAESSESRYLLIILFKMIAYTRDIISGKGECSLSYMMLTEWYNIVDKESAILLLKYFVSDSDSDSKLHHPYGSWKDLKYLCNYLNNTEMFDSTLIDESIKIMNKQLKYDVELFDKNEKNNISLVAKWIPREKSNKFCWIYTKLACDYYSHYFNYVNRGSLSYKKAIMKSKTEYRKLLSKLNGHLDTLQKKQCANDWSNINFNNVTSISLHKQKNAFLNRRNSDRICCSENFKNYISEAEFNINSKIKIKSKRISIIDLIKEAIKLIKTKNENDQQNNDNNSNLIKRKILDMQWKNNNMYISDTIGKTIPLIDLSNSMESDSFYAAIGLGIKIAEKSVLEKRLMTFSSYPSWINLDKCSDFVSMVEAVYHSNYNLGTNFYAALDMILDSIVENRMAPEAVQELSLIVLSDMQMDIYLQHNSNKTLYDNIKMKYVDAGIKIWNKPYKMPHIIFWNLRSTNGFPCLSDQMNCSMISGFNPAIIDTFCEKKFTDLFSLSTTPWSNFEKILNNERYKFLEEKLDKIFNNKE